MAEEIKDQPENGAADDDSGRSYERSKIVFPYGDLDDGIEVVKPIYNRGGSSATFDQLADWMNHDNVNSGAFRVKIASARIFGLVLVDKDNVTLTPLGRDINDPNTEIAGRAKAFLQVPLYRKIFDTYKGGPLPSKDADLEKVIESFGVASKQAKRARQTFQRSAEQAKVFNEKKDRLVLPAGVSLDSSKAPDGGASRKMETPNVFISSSGELSPLIAALIEELPTTGEWSRDERDFWARIFLRTVDKLYKVKE
jgi:hypothetical protein